MTSTISDFLLDPERLLGLAGDMAYQQGLRYHKNDHVMEVYEAQGQLLASVDEVDSEMPLQLVLGYTHQQKLEVECDCHGDPSRLCRHAVAALLRFAEQQQEDPGYLSARESAIQDRIKRGQTEVRVEPLDPQAWFGLWSATSLIADPQWQRRYRVTIRALDERLNHCSCPDFANNQLGTCKHIEAALHQIRKRSQATGEGLPPPKPFIYHRWQAGPAIWIQRTGALSPALTPLIDRYFDPQGQFIGELPDGFYALSDALYGCEEIVIGEDARQAVAHLATEQAHRLRSQAIARRILQSDGRLPGIDTRLYPYQIEGVAFLAGNGRALLADDMGLGKTLQAIAAASWLIAESGVQRVLIVCPASLKQQWAREIERFTGHASQVIQGGAQDRQAQYRQDKRFFIANYELVLRDLSVINATLVPDLLILDEAQRIKNWRTQIATAVKRINSQYAFVLSGTPLENRLEDLYSLMQVVDQRLLGPLWRYLADFHIRDDKGKVLGYRNLAELRQRIAPAMLRRNRSIVSAQLPECTTTRLDIPLTEEQRQLHDSALANASRLASIAKRRPLTPSERNRLMAALQQARMACDAAGLIDKEIKGAPKLKELRTLVEELCLEGGRKMVVFSQWRRMTELVAEMLAKLGVGFVHLHGGVPSQRRGALMDSFAQDDGVSVFLSTDAGGTGLNLQSATVLVNLDIPWNPAVLEQRNARIHRLGQRDKVQIILMIAADSYEARVYQLVNNKQELFDNVVSPDATEEVVGVSQQALSLLVDELNQAQAERPEGEGADADAESVPADAPPAAAEPSLEPAARTDAVDDLAVNRGIAALQAQFGPRIAQMLAKGGGLLLILERVTAEDEAFVDQLDIAVPVALLDECALRQLQRLGGDSPLGDAATIPLAAVPPLPSPWLLQAQKHLRAARLLLEQGLDSGVLELLACATAAVATEIANLPQRLPVEQLSVWLYADALPQQWLDDQQATQINRLLGLRAASQIPPALLEQVHRDTEALIGPYLARL